MEKVDNLDKDLSNKDQEDAYEGGEGDSEGESEGDSEPEFDWFDEEYYSKKTSVVQLPEMDTAVREIVKVMEKYKITEENKLHAVITAELFAASFKTTSYYKNYKKTSREEDLRSAIDDLFQVVSYDQEIIEYFYETDKGEPETVVTKIWTTIHKIPLLLNFVLIVDAGKHIDFDKSDMPFFDDDIAE